MFLVPPLLKLNICYHLAKENVLLIALAFLLPTFGVKRCSQHRHSPSAAE